MSEDCLRLNIWAPEASVGSETRLPVMIWLHGGAYVFGSATSQVYDGHRMASGNGHVVVSINHRLGVFGYTFLGSNPTDPFRDAGNAGHMDILAALRWVKSNIDRFGGDPSNITLFGESGGGGKVSTICAMPDFRGLFHKAIVQSGSVGPLQPEFADRVTQRLFQDLGIRSGNIAALHALSSEALLKCEARLLSAAPKDEFALLMWGPVGDGLRLPPDAWRTGAPSCAHDVPMIIGTNLHETALLIERYWQRSDGDAALVKAIDAATITKRTKSERIAEAIAKYRMEMPELGDSELHVRVSTDLGFWGSAVHQAETKAAAGGAPAYMYECAWKTPCRGAMWAPHGIEIPFVFNVHDYASAWDGTDSDATRAAADPQDLRRHVGQQVLAAWASFARTGNPSTAALAWPQYRGTTRSTMVFDSNSRISDDPRGAFRALATTV